MRTSNCTCGPKQTPVPHAGLDGLTPLTVLVNKVEGNDT